MKWLDEVCVISKKEKYENKGIKVGAVGTILMPEIRENKFYVAFCDKDGKEIANIEIDIDDLKLVKSSNITNQDILEELPSKNPKWWCKVENGFILNLLDERKNAIPYKYN